MAFTITHECVGCSVCMRICPVDAIVGKPKERHHIVSEICIDCGACGRICPHASVKTPEGQLCERIRIRSRWPNRCLTISAAWGASSAWNPAQQDASI